MALNIIIKNTFLDVDESDGSPCGSARRSSSVPCTWRPGYSFDNDTCQRPGSTRSLASTAASEEDLNDLQDSHEEKGLPPKRACTDGVALPKASFLNPAAAEFQMPTYDMQAMKLATPSGIRLNPEARAFEPMVEQMGMGLPAEISTVINSAKHALMTSPHVINVKVTEGQLGQQTTIVAEMSNNVGPYGAKEVLGAAKAALLAAAARSEITYVLGWSSQPFQDMADDSGFKGMVGSIPLSMQGQICWDTYERGYCPRRSVCRWCHPLENDLVPIRVVLKRSEVDA